jgi:hypothetical protein
MLSPVEQLEPQHQAFISGVSFIIHNYEPGDGRRFQRQRDGSYTDGQITYPSLVEMLEHLHAPITGGQIYALIAIYHPLITSRTSLDRTPNEISRSEARDLVLGDFSHITPEDIQNEGGVLRLGPIGSRPTPRESVAAEPVSEPQQVLAVLQIRYSAHHRLDAEGIRDQIQNDTARLLEAQSQSLVHAQQVEIAHIAAGEAPASVPGISREDAAVPAASAPVVQSSIPGILGGRQGGISSTSPPSSSKYISRRSFCAMARNCCKGILEAGIHRVLGMTRRSAHDKAWAAALSAPLRARIRQTYTIRATMNN